MSLRITIVCLALLMIADVIDTAEGVKARFSGRRVGRLRGKVISDCLS